MGTSSMESSVQRRLDTLSRHLLLSPETVDNHLLHPNHLGAVQLRSVDLVPVIVGGMVLDIHARPSIEANPRTTTPGKVQHVRGGVARNVAECMSKLGTRPYMISVVGLDMAGDLLLEHWKSSRLPIEGIRKCQDAVTPVVSIIFDSHGELAAGVASVEAVETFLTPEWICQFRCNILSAPVLMVDANVHPRSLEAACQIAAESHIPVWFEPVSVSKSKRIASIAQYVTYASPNEDELIAMANTLSCSHEFHLIQRLDKNGNRLSIESIFQMLKPAIWVLLEKGIKVLILTLGSYGVLLCSREGPDFMRKAAKNTNPSSFGDRLHELVSSSYPSDQFIQAVECGRSNPFVLHFPALPASVVSLTGAGDCLVGGTLSSICAGLDIMQSLAVGVAASKAAVETEDNIPPEYCLKTISVLHLLHKSSSFGLIEPFTMMSNGYFQLREFCLMSSWCNLWVDGLNSNLAFNCADLSNFKIRCNVTTCVDIRRTRTQKGIAKASRLKKTVEDSVSHFLWLCKKTNPKDMWQTSHSFSHRGNM